MKIFLTSVTSLMFFLLAVKQFLINRRVIQPDEDKKKVIPYVDVVTAFNIICGAFDVDAFYTRLPFSIILCVAAMYLSSLSFLSYKGFVCWIVRSIVVLELFSGLWTLCSMTGIIPCLSNDLYVFMTILIVGVVFAVYMYGIYIRLKDIKNVMRTGSVWTNVTLAVDSLYLGLILLTAMFYVLTASNAGADDMWCSVISSFLFFSLSMALSVRMLNSSAFVFMTDHECRIVESMKISHVDTAQDSTGTAVLYKNLYDRVLEYFAESRPYLNPNLTINDVAGVVFSNRLYISKAISQFTGRNFCQFVNYYRVIHAIELYRGNTGLKVLELASLSGFNSVVSFGMAFRLYMGEKPGDWCRREKNRLDKLKK